MIVDKSRRGITLTEILISIMILGIGLVSLATLFPIGLIRLRDASRYTRTTYLAESAAADAAARGIFSAQSFAIADLLNTGAAPYPFWFATTNVAGPNAYNPLIQDTPSYGGDIYTVNPTPPPAQILQGIDVTGLAGYGLPFAYDPLWRYQTVGPAGTPGYYPDPIGLTTLEARFGSGIGFIRDEPAATASGSVLPSAHGLQRITNFNYPAVMPAATQVPAMFVSPEDVVWQEAANTGYTVNGTPNGVPVGVPSPVVPDLTLPTGAAAATPPSIANDWHYSWMFTGYQVSGTGGSQFEGNIVIFENRPFAISVPSVIPNAPAAPVQAYQVDGETVVEAIFGHGANLNAAGYAVGADRTVLLRWYSTVPDPVVKVGDWIADVTYERHQQVVYNTTSQTGRFLNGVVVNGNTVPAGVPNPFHNGEWDNMPAQRCTWYQVQKVAQPIDDPYVATANGTTLRSMVVYVDRSIESRTVLTSIGVPAVINAALISPYVVNVIPQQITVRSNFLNSQLSP